MILFPVTSAYRLIVVIGDGHKSLNVSLLKLLGKERMFMHVYQGFLDLTFNARMHVGCDHYQRAGRVAAGIQRA